MDIDTSFNRLFAAYYDLCEGVCHPRTVRLNPLWKAEWGKRFKGEWRMFLDAEVTFDESVPDFEFGNVGPWFSALHNDLENVDNG